MQAATAAGGDAVYDPRGTVDVEQVALARRPQTVEGLRLAVLDNTKWNANRLLRATVEALQGHALGETRHYKKESFSKNADPDLLRRIARENDLALVAIGD